jgi:hypothetical protein
MSEKKLKEQIAQLEREKKEAVAEKNTYEITLKILAIIGLVIAFYYFAIWANAIAHKAAIDFTTWYEYSEFNRGMAHGASGTFFFIFTWWLIPKFIGRHSMDW